MTERFEVRRVVVALDALCDNRGAVAAGVDLVARWRCSFAGVFIVEPDLVRLGAMPEVRQVRLSGGGAQVLGASDLEADIAARERRARRAMAEAAGRIGITHSFAVARGGFPIESAGLGTGDLLVVEGTPGRYDARGRFEARWRRVAATVRNPMLLLRRRGTAPGAVAVLYDGGAAAARAVGAAVRLAADRGAPLAVILAPDADPGVELEFAALREPAGRQPRFVRVASDESGTWRRALAAVRPALVVVPVQMPADRWSEGTDSDVLLIH